MRQGGVAGEIIAKIKGKQARATEVPGNTIQGLFWAEWERDPTAQLETL